MFGIIFDGSSELRRILMWDEYPLLSSSKGVPLAGIETDLPADDVAEVTEAEVEPAPMMGGPFVCIAEQGFMSDPNPEPKTKVGPRRKKSP